MSKEKPFVKIYDDLTINIDDIAELRHGIEKKTEKDDRGHGLIIERKVDGEAWVSVLMKTSGRNHTIHGERALAIRKAIEDHRTV